MLAAAVLLSSVRGRQTSELEADSRSASALGLALAENFRSSSLGTEGVHSLALGADGVRSLSLSSTGTAQYMGLVRRAA